MNALETYLKDLRDIRSTGAAVAETSFYPALSNLLNEIGKIAQAQGPLRHQSWPIAGRACPTAACSPPTSSRRRGDAEPKPGQLPARGAIGSQGRQAEDGRRRLPPANRSSEYCTAYGLVLVTNFRDFLLLGRGAERASPRR